jgi:protoporphyrin/coproporphyrin ferrochelatase
MKRTGVLLINLGTPDAPTPDAVGSYLREFLMDGFVIDVPAPVRWFLVNVMIVPRRKYQSARAYQKVQLNGGSPLLVYTRELAGKVGRQLGDDYYVEFAMRYGRPSIASALASLKSQDVARIVVLPLYPQYAESSYRTAVEETKRRAGELGLAEHLSFVPPFYDRAEFVNSFAGRIEENVNVETTDHVVFSFHGLPVRHVQKLDSTKAHCSVAAGCCAEISDVNRDCYRAQCMATTRLIAQALQLNVEDYTVSFQSRLGRAKWIEPNTEAVLKDLAGRGLKRVAVVCPSFVADCLETLEEIGIRGRETFIAAGGEELQLIPSLNAEPVWVQGVVKWIREAS